MSGPRRRQTPTSIDVALLAGVSKSAVSRSFTDGGTVSAQTRTRVIEAARALGYKPNPIARSLSTRRSAIVGLAMGFMDQLYAPLLTLLSERLNREGLRLLLFKADPDHIADRELDKIINYNVDALVLASVRLSSEFALHCQQVRIPVIQFNPTLEAHPLSSITGSDEEGGRKIGELLLAGGHRRFAFMSGFHGTLTSEARRRGFEQVLQAAGFPRPIYDCGGFTFEGGLLAARRLLSAPEPPDAIFCANDSMACATIDIARREHGIAIGSALSVVGFDNEPIASWPAFDLTTFTLPLDQTVDEIIALMKRMWADPADLVDSIVPGELIVRGSTRHPATK